MTRRGFIGRLLAVAGGIAGVVAHRTIGAHDSLVHHTLGNYTVGEEREFGLRRWASIQSRRRLGAYGEWSPPEPMPGDPRFEIAVGRFFLPTGSTATDWMHKTVMFENFYTNAPFMVSIPEGDAYEFYGFRRIK